MHKYILPTVMFLAAVLLPLLTASACEPEPGPQHFPSIEVPPTRIQAGYFAVYNSLNGLPCNNIRSLLIQAPEGESELVIAGTQEAGLMVFDGESWYKSGGSRFEKLNVTVNSMARIDDNSFLAGTSNGIFKCLIENNKITASPMSSGSDTNLNVLAISKSANEDDAFYIACDRTVGKLQGNSFIPFSVPAYLSPTGFASIIGSELGNFTGCHGGLLQINANALTEIPQVDNTIGWVTDFAAAEKRLFIASANGLFMTSDMTKLTNLLPGIWCSRAAFSAFPQDLRSEDNSARQAAKREISELVDDSDVFAGLREEYTRLQQDYAEYTQRYAGQREAPQTAVSEMYGRFFDFENRMAAAVANLNASGQSDMYVNANGVITNTVKSPLVKGLWVGTQNSGLVLFAENGERYHLTRENSKLPSDCITAIAAQDDGEAWFGTDTGGIMRYTRRRMSGKGKLTQLQSCEPTRIRVIADILYIGTKSKGMHLYQISPLKSLGQFSAESVEGFHRLVTDFAIDKDGNLWVTGDRGVWKWDGKAWRQIEFRRTQPPMAGRIANRIHIDGNDRIFVAFAASGKAYEQIFIYDGSNLVGTTPETIAEILAAHDKERYLQIKLHNLDGGYMRSFDFGNATQSLQNFEKDESAKVTALLNTEHYLLIGMENGLQKIFDGESFKLLSEKGTGKIGAILNLFRMPSGRILIQGDEGVSEFDGQHYRLIESAASGAGFKVNDICLDQMNPETFRIAFTSSDGGGYALYQNGFWEKYHTKQPVNSIAQSDFVIFMAMPDGVYYLPE